VSASGLRFAIDANALVGGALSISGRAMLTHPGIRLIIAEYTRDEVRERLLTRVEGMVRTGQIAATDAAVRLAAAITLVEAVALPISFSAYQKFETEARERLPHDQDDWHTVALALAFGIAIWTNDKHYLGCGIPVWTTETLRRRIAAGRLLDDHDR